MDIKIGDLFHTEVRKGIYLITHDGQKPTDDGRSMAPGEPTGNSYLVIGEDRALLFDLAVNHPGVRAYAQQLAGKPLMLVLSHGHGDHTYHLQDWEEVWMHPADTSLLKGMLGFPAIEPCPTIHPLQGGDSIDLGDRILDVIHIPGHTDGSILLLDHATRTLLSGDTVARRLLYGTMTFVPPADFCRQLEALQQADFEVVYSAHDRCALPREQAAHMIRLIREKLPGTEKIFRFGSFRMLWLVHSEPQFLDFFDMVFPIAYKDTL